MACNFTANKSVSYKTGCQKHRIRDLVKMHKYGRSASFRPSFPPEINYPINLTNYTHRGIYKIIIVGIVNIIYNT